MKLRLTFKDPDHQVQGLGYDGIWDDVTDIGKRKAEKLLKKYVEWDEYITVEFDTDAGTATVVEV